MRAFRRTRQRGRSGTTLIESIVGIFVFVMIAFALYQTFMKLSEAVGSTRVRITATALAAEQIELIRNLPYSQVGTQGGVPSGTLLQSQTVSRNGIDFTVRITVRNVDDPFDGKIGQVPNDLSPADYKLTEIEVSCAACRGFKPVVMTTTAAPKNLETASNNGALFIQVFDANGIPVSEANVNIINASATPAINLNETTGANGLLQLVDVPPGVNKYQIIVSKPHATVALQQVTQISFAIDRVAEVPVTSVTPTCLPIPSFDFNLKGAKLIGTGPDVLKYNQNLVTNALGALTLSDMEWDTYEMTVTDDSFVLAGSVPGVPIGLVPGSTQNLQLIVAPKVPKAAVISVKDLGTQLPLSEATVQMTGPLGYDLTTVTGRGYLRQTDWSGGAGQEVYATANQYLSDDGNIDIDSPAGDLILASVFGDYALSGILTSSTFDTGSPSNFYQFTSLPVDQPPAAGQSAARFQIATNNDSATWEYLGPDGTPWSYYTATNTNINAIHNGTRYLRYRAYLATDAATATPNVSEVAFTFTSSCIPPGQVLFSGLVGGTYTYTVTRAGYQSASDTVEVTSDWQTYDVLLSP